ncbi:hypothetical protein GCM10010102_09640 [Promicromonospora citrea]|uniref:Uncharacterized protein n=1 Tax=Promicromonospora citrea TaxID=43677 RepID=A0A8H9GF52_9MICO|nr:hypothetical protein GCM10010102_09640 [Promicromonospora citrea]
MAGRVPVQVDRGDACNRPVPVLDHAQAARAPVRLQRLSGPRVDLRLHALGPPSGVAVEPVGDVGACHVHDRPQERGRTVGGHQTEGVVGVQVGDEDVVDVRGRQARRPEVVEQVTRARAQGGARTGVDQHGAAGGREQEGVDRGQQVALGREEPVGEEVGEALGPFPVHVRGEDRQRAVPDRRDDGRADPGPGEARGLDGGWEDRDRHTSIVRAAAAAYHTTSWVGRTRGPADGRAPRRPSPGQAGVSSPPVAARARSSRAATSCQLARFQNAFT